MKINGAGHEMTWRRALFALLFGAAMWNFLSGSNLTMWVADIEKPNETVFPDRPAFAVLMVVHDVLKPTIFFRAGFWLLACLLILALA